MDKIEIITLPNDALRHKSKNVEKVDEKTKKIIADLLASLRTMPGYGLAAPQIGHKFRIAVIESKEIRDEEGNVISEAIPLHVLVNPEIIKFSKDKCEMEEGCFSVPGYYGPVTRPKQVKVKAINENGKSVQINAGGMLARVLQHEIDHLDGILFVDRIDDINKLHKVEVQNTEETEM